jgi:threonine dehydrogenase-like Zn-dependent dehydrogenase
METREIFNKDGIVCLFGVYMGKREETIDIESFNMDLVFNNKAVFGSVSSNRRHFERGVGRMMSIESKWPGLLKRFFTRSVALGNIADGLQHNPYDIKVLVEIAK